MALRYGIDTSVLVRLVTRTPESEFERCVDQLRVWVEDRGCEIFASNLVVGEAYAAIVHHYGMTGADARAALLDVLTSGLVAPLNGRAAMDALAASGGPGLFDRLITDDYSRAGVEVLTLDRRMASLPGARRLRECEDA